MGNMGRAEFLPPVPRIHGIDILASVMALRLDMSGNLYRPKLLTAVIHLVKICRSLIRAWRTDKSPCPVQTLFQRHRSSGEHILFRLVKQVRGVRLFSVHSENFRIFQPFQAALYLLHSIILQYYLSFHGTCHTCHKLLLHQEEDQRSRNRRQHDCCHHHTVIRCVGRAHCRHDQRQRPFLR